MTDSSNSPATATRGRRRKSLAFVLTASVLGTAAFLALTASVRAFIDRHEGEIAAEADAETAAADSLLELELQADRLAGRLSVIHSEIMLASSAGDTLPDLWSYARGAARFESDETLVLSTGGGEIVAAVGELAKEPGAAQHSLRKHSIIGRAGGIGIRSGLVRAAGVGHFAVSLPLAHARADAAPGDLTPPRITLVSPVRSSLGPTSRGERGVEFWPIGTDELPESVRHVPAELWRNDGLFTERVTDGARSYRAIEDASKRHAFLLVAEARTRGSGALPAGLAESLVWEALAAAVAMILALRATRSRLVRPLAELQRHASRLTRTEHGKLAFYSEDRGEVGELARVLDDLLGKLQADRSEHIRSARIAGMSDVSMGVVHSAGNILNSVNVSTKLLARDLATIGISDLRAMVTELNVHKDELGQYVTEDPNGRFLIPFLSAMTDSLSDLQTRCMVELEAVDGGVAHVIDLIKSQEKYAIGASVIEVAAVHEVVEQALSIASLAHERAGEITIERSYVEIDEVRIDRHKLTSVLINIIANAVEALGDDDVKVRKLELSIYPMNSERFVIEILDTGNGIAPENLESIFSSAFSTKKNSPGQGLHTTANLCKELGIAIGAVSEGIGLGCVFKLRVPFQPLETESQRASAADSKPLAQLDSVAAALPTSSD